MRERPLIATCMMANKPYGAIYTGVTSNLYQRAYEHREGLLPGFTRQWGLKRLVWHAVFETMKGAIRNENTLKGYKRD